MALIKYGPQIQPSEPEAIAILSASLSTNARGIFFPLATSEIMNLLLLRRREQGPDGRGGLWDFRQNDIRLVHAFQWPHFSNRVFISCSSNSVDFHAPKG